MLNFSAAEHFVHAKIFKKYIRQLHSTYSAMVCLNPNLDV